MSLLKQKQNQKLGLFKDVQLHRAKKGLLGYLQWKGFTDDDDQLLKLTNHEGETIGYLDMLEVLGKDLDYVYGAGSDAASQIVYGYQTLLNTYTEDFDILITQMPADTHVQQQNFSRLLQEINVTIQQTSKDAPNYKQLLQRRKVAQRQLNHAQFVADHIDHEAYTVFIYGDTAADTIRLRQQFKQLGGSAVTTRDKPLADKEAVLALLANPGRQLYGH